MDNLSIFLLLVFVITLIGFGIAYFQDYRQKHSKQPH
ncbi:MAG: hypothetical protein HW390_2860 [Candidatus Brocadiaceae bacterium]|nr:hypothetical protein [Candidatus Brocadiaceae bacterium]